MKLKMFLAAVVIAIAGTQGVAVAAAPGGDSQQTGRGESEGFRPRSVVYPDAPQFPSDLDSISGPRFQAGEIERRISQVSPGGSVFLEEGIYSGPVVVDKPVRIDGGGRAVIDGGGAGTVVTLRASEINLSGVVVRASGVGPVGGPMGIRVEKNNVTIENSVVYDTYIGIGVFGSNGARIVGNVVRGRGKGAIIDEGHATGSETSARDAEELTQRGDAISLWDSNAALIRGNRVERARDGIYTSFGNEMLIDSNLVENSRYALHTMFTKDVTVAENGFRSNLSGVVLMYGGPVLLLRNAIERNHSPSTGFGVLVKDVSAVEVNSSVIAENRIGISLEGQSDPPTKVTMNTVALNQIGVVLQPTAQAVFSINSFVDNTTQVVAQGTEVQGKNAWYDRGIGNYWSNYKGYDQVGEGLGDVEHAEGGAVATLIANNPMLEALASSTAFKMVGAVEDRWAGKRPVALDPKPMMEPRSPRLETEPSPAAGAAGRILAIVGLIFGVLVVLRMRAPARRQSGARDELNSFDSRQRRDSGKPKSGRQ